jgi:hypothetical protein
MRGSFGRDKVGMARGGGLYFLALVSSVSLLRRRHLAPNQGLELDTQPEREQAGLDRGESGNGNMQWGRLE